MLHVFAKTTKGYAHIKDKKPCQDYSACYQDKERTIITCCDGHGGAQYIRSQLGSKMASTSVLNVLLSVTPSMLHREKKEDLENKIKLSILCEWNRMIEENLSKKKIRRQDLKDLDEDQIDALKINPTKAYGTTLTGALLLENKLLVVGIGDTEVISFRKGKMTRVLEDDDDPVGNVTYSMCQEDAYSYLRVKVLDFKTLDGIILCTDGLSSPYQSYTNFNQSFIKPIVKKIYEEKNTIYIDKFIENLAKELGNGDDVSLSFIIKDNVVKKYYK